jgi:hypothetical protein
MGKGENMPERCEFCKFFLYGDIYEGDTSRKGWYCELDGYAVDSEDWCGDYEEKDVGEMS